MREGIMVYCDIIHYVCSTPKVWVGLLSLHDSVFEVCMFTNEESEQACVVDRPKTDQHTNLVFL